MNRARCAHTARTAVDLPNSLKNDWFGSQQPSNHLLHRLPLLQQPLMQQLRLLGILAQLLHSM